MLWPTESFCKSVRGQGVINVKQQSGAALEAALDAGLCKLGGISSAHSNIIRRPCSKLCSDESVRSSSDSCFGVFLMRQDEEETATAYSPDYRNARCTNRMSESSSCFSS